MKSTKVQGVTLGAGVSSEYSIRHLIAMTASVHIILRTFRTYKSSADGLDI